MLELWVCAEKKQVGGLKKWHFYNYLQYLHQVIVWHGNLNTCDEFHCAFFSLSYSVMYNIKYGAGPCCTDVVEVPVRKYLCVRELHDRHHVCRRLLGAPLVPGWCWERSPGVQFILTIPTCSVLIRDHLWLTSSWSTQLCPSPHSGCTWQEIQSEKKEKQTTGSSLLSPSKCCYFLTCIYIPT